MRSVIKCVTTITLISFLIIIVGCGAVNNDAQLDYDGVHIVYIESESMITEMFSYDEGVTIYRRVKSGDYPLSITALSSREVYLKDKTEPYNVSGLNSDDIITYVNSEMSNAVNIVKSGKYSVEHKISETVAERVICNTGSEKITLVKTEKGSHIAVPKNINITLTNTDIVSKIYSYGLKPDMFGLSS